MKRPWLAPLVPLYRAGQALSARFTRVQRLNWPVISIGNLSTGGAGKTPLTIALAKALKARGVYVDVLSRGYGRKNSEPMRVQLDGSVEIYGDEPLLISREAGIPVYVARERYDAGLLAERETRIDGGLAVHLLDDGFQHRQLHRDVDVVLLSGRDLADSLLPAGNLREDLRAFHRATVLAVPAGDYEIKQYLSKIIPIDRNTEYPRWQGPIWQLNRRMEVAELDSAAVAFCGIARPEQFFAGLESAGVQLAARIAFRDHHAYTQADIARLKSALKSSGATALLTTEKDAVRLGSLAAGLPLKTVPLRTEIESEDVVLDWLIKHIQP